VRSVYRPWYLCRAATQPRAAARQQGRIGSRMGLSASPDGSGLDRTPSITALGRSGGNRDSPPQKSPGKPCTAATRSALRALLTQRSGAAVIRPGPGAAVRSRPGAGTAVRGTPPLPSRPPRARFHRRPQYRLSKSVADRHLARAQRPPAAHDWRLFATTSYGTSRPGFTHPSAMLQHSASFGAEPEEARSHGLASTGGFLEGALPRSARRFCPGRLELRDRALPAHPRSLVEASLDNENAQRRRPWSRGQTSPVLGWSSCHDYSILRLAENSVAHNPRPRT